MTNVVIVDDHPVILTTLCAMLKNQNYNILDTFRNGGDTLNFLRSNNNRVDIIIIDINLPDMDGLDLTNRIKNIDNNIKILIFSAQNSIYFARRSMESGASGFISKENDLSQVTLAINSIKGGYNFFPEGTFNQSTNKRSSNPLELLSTKELLVLNMLISGNSNSEIAKKLSLSEKTISTYKKRVLEKTGSRNTIDLIDLTQRNKNNGF
ncbi:response regulator [Vibrio anguillarum]|uniref:response regulator transcription factor n=1 Tax=Vibrio anguillarum TaxID=55601 RepID=UPI00030BEFCC|nr:response regulator transcription factor [Vibrio anguillarum]OEE35452.1 two-component system response regulator [Vibrio anguillarum]OEF92162.1 two-component system response regulator [Vibrio anguillarum]